MIDSTNLPLLVSALAWPVVVLISVLVFRRPVKAMLERVVGFKSDYVNFDLSGGKSGENPFSEAASIKTKLKLDKPGNIYWAASDVMETIMRLINPTISAPLVFASFKQFSHHARAIGAYEMPHVGPRLAEIYKRLESMPSAELTIPLRQEYIRDLHQIMGAIGKSLESAQPDFGAAQK